MWKGRGVEPGDIEHKNARSAAVAQHAWGQVSMNRSPSSTAWMVCQEQAKKYPDESARPAGGHGNRGAQLQMLGLDVQWLSGEMLGGCASDGQSPAANLQCADTNHGHKSGKDPAPDRAE